NVNTSKCLQVPTNNSSDGLQPVYKDTDGPSNVNTNCQLVTTNNNLMVSKLLRRTQTHLKREHKQMSTSHNNDLTVSTCLQGHRQPETFKPASTSPAPSQ